MCLLILFTKYMAVRVKINKTAKFKKIYLTKYISKQG